MVLSLFLYANPLFGIIDSWPWEHFARIEDPRTTATAVLWSVTGLWALFMAFTRAARLRVTVLFALVAPLIFILCDPSAANSVSMTMAVSRYDTSELVLMTLMGGGLAYSLQRTSTRTGAWIAAGAAACLLAHLLISPTMSYADTKLTHYLRDLPGAWERGLFSGEPITPQTSQRDETMFNLIPMAMILLTCVIAITTLFGIRWRWWLWCGIALLLLPSITRHAYMTLAGSTGGEEPGTAGSISTQLYNMLVPDALAPLMIAVFAFGEVARAQKLEEREVRHA